MATEVKFTKGPWEFSLSNHYGYSVLWNPETRQEVLTTSGVNDGDHPITWMGEEASEADLALICAAPDLLEALRPFADMDFLIVGGGSEAVIAMCDRARDALNKAEGK